MSCLIKTTVLLICSLMLFSGYILGQNFTYPLLEKEGNSAKDLIPDGWSVLDSVSGDLNGDSFADIAVVFQYRDSVQIISNDEYYPDTSHFQPRILAVYFKDNTLEKYVFKERNNTFIISSTHHNMAEPFEDIRIDNGLLILDFLSWWSMGTWWMTRITYEFRYLNGQFILIACEYTSTHRASLESTCYNIDFLKEEYSITRTEHTEDGLVETVELKKITYPEIQTLRGLNRPFEWEFEEGITI
ncbi:hypothetical protein JXL83_02430 [candidate division WOR-3 bacterium]|nr:hypothetical protein [candidate division WOR-3 bacterium]